MIKFSIANYDYTNSVREWLLENANDQYSITIYTIWPPSLSATQINLFNEELAVRFKLTFSEIIKQSLD